jgi:hypothetical protein
MIFFNILILISVVPLVGVTLLGTSTGDQRSDLISIRILRRLCALVSDSVDLRPHNQLTSIASIYNDSSNSTCRRFAGVNLFIISKYHSVDKTLRNTAYTWG